MAQQDTLLNINWSRNAFRTDSKTDLVNILSEVFNNYIIDYHDKQIQTMMECIRTRLMNMRHHTRVEGRSAHWEITPYMAEKRKMRKLMHGTTGQCKQEYQFGRLLALI